MQEIANLNRFYKRQNKLFFEYGPGGMPYAKIRTERARATIAMYGGQLVSYRPASSEHDLFYLSKYSLYHQGKAIRGGIPICWPWFGDDPTSQGKQAHGFARNIFWQVEDVHIRDNVVTIKLEMQSSSTTKQWWRHDFKLTKVLTIGDELTITLTTENKGWRNMTLSEALHSYFMIGDINQASVVGLDQVEYLDKTQNFAQFRQIGDIKVESEFDRIYLDTPNTVKVIDPVLNRQIHIEQSGAQNFVVWNPWHKAQSMADVQDVAYQNFICVETANALPGSIVIPAKQTHSMQVKYRLSEL